MKLNSILAAAALLMAATASQAATNLVQNGSFEYTVNSSTTQSAGSWSTYDSIVGWSGLQGKRDIVEVRNNVAGTAQDGFSFIELDTHAFHGQSNAVNSTNTTNSTIFQDVLGTG